MAQAYTGTRAASRINVRSIALWALQLLGALALFGAGFAKLMGAPEMVALFEVVGIGQWFRYLTGALEVGGALLLLIPALAGVGGLLLAGAMMGAIFTELFIRGGSALPPLVLLVIVGTVAYAYRDRTLRLMGRGRAA